MSGVPKEDNSAAACIAYANECRLRGNDHFKAHRFSDAQLEYSNGLNALDPVVVVSRPSSDGGTEAAVKYSPSDVQEATTLHVTLLSNRAQSAMFLSSFEEAVQDCKEGLSRDPTHTKLLFRLALCYARMRDGPAYTATLTQMTHRLEELRGLGTHDALRLEVESALAELHAQVAALREPMWTAAQLLETVACVCVKGSPRPCSMSATRLLKCDPRIAATPYVSPVCLLLGLPFALIRTDYPRGDNQFATYIMIQPDSGFALPMWQQDAGEVILVRKDLQDTTVNHAWDLWDYFNVVLDAWGDADAATKVPCLMTRKAFCDMEPRFNEAHPGVKLDWHFRDDA